MKPYTGKASVIWTGRPPHGHGAVTTPSTALTKAPYGTGREIKRKATNPSELIAAAHASSFSMTLADELRTAGYTTHQIDTTATITMEHIAMRWTMTRIHLEVLATVRDGEQFDFVDATLRAKANCPVSRLLTANISLQAQLKRGSGRTPRPARQAVGDGSTGRLLAASRSRAKRAARS